MNEQLLKNIWNRLTADGKTTSDFDTWMSNISNNPDVQTNVHTYLVEQNLTQNDFDTWSTNTGLKKKDDSELPPISQGEDTDSTGVTVDANALSASGQAPRELSYIEEQFQTDVPDAKQNFFASRGGVFPTGYKTPEQGGNVTYNQELITALNNDPGIIDALQKGKINVEDIRNASSNKKELREKAIKKLQEYRAKSSEEIEEIIINERLDTPFIYENASTEDGFLEDIYENIDGLEGINKKDFDGFITSTGLKADYLDKLNKGLLDSSSNYVFGQDDSRFETTKEMEELRMLTLYLEDVQKRDRRFQEIDYRKRNKGLSMKSEDFDYMPTDYVNPASLSEFINNNMPNYVRELQQNQVEARALYQRYKNDKVGVGFTLWEMAKSAGTGLLDRVNQVTATISDLLGADTYAEDIRLATEYARFIEDPNLHYTYVEGKEVEVGGVNYLVNSKGNIFDIDHKANVTALLDENSRNIIRSAADTQGEKGSSLSPQGAAIDTAGVIGSLIVDLALTKNVSQAITATGSFAKGAGILGNTMKTLRSVPMDRGLASAFIAQSSLGFSMGIENTLREAKAAGLSDEEAQELALVAAQEMAVLYGLTSFISPQTKATEAFFGRINTSSMIGRVMEVSKNAGGKVPPATFAQNLKSAGFKLLEYGGEGVKEFVQENVQQIGERYYVNPSINDRAAQKIMATTITGEEFINTSILSFAAGMIMPGLGDAIGVNNFKNSNIDKLQMLGLLNQNKEKTISLLDSQVADGYITQEQRDNVVNQMDVYAGSINFIPRDLDSDTAASIMEDVYEINKLEQQKQETNVKAVKQRIEQKIEEANNRISKAVDFGDLDSSTKKRLKQEAREELQEQNPNRSITDKEVIDYAIQKSSTEGVDVRQQSPDGQTVREGDTEGATTETGQETEVKSDETQEKTEVVQDLESRIETEKNKIEETKKDKSINRPTKAARIEESRLKIVSLEQLLQDELNQETKQEPKEVKKLDRDSRLTPEQVKQAQKEEEFTPEQKEGNFFSRFLNNAKRKVKQLFSTRGNLPRNLFKFQEQKQNQANRILFRASRKAAQFANLFDELRKTRSISEKELKKLNKDLSKVLKGEMDLKDIKYTNKKGEVKNISKKLGELIVKMRQDIDVMSKQILDAPNIGKDATREVIEKNLGKYVTRSYRLFEGALSGAEFRKTLKEEVIEDAKEFFRKDKQIIKAAEEEADRIRSQTDEGKPKTQKEQVKKVLGKVETGTIKQITKITGLPEPTVRRILGQGAKKGEYTRVAPGVYTLITRDGKSAAVVQGADALVEIKKLVNEGAKFDMVFLDPPYVAPGTRGGNRNLAKYKKVTPEQFNEFVADVKKLLRTPDTPVIFMFSANKSNKAALAKYSKAFENNGLKNSGVAVSQKLYPKSLKPKQMGGHLLKEWVFIYSQSGKKRTDIDFEFEQEYYFPEDSKYQTAKPVALLEALIKASTKAGEVILDPFAGSGSTAKAATGTGRSVVTFEEDTEQAGKIAKELEQKGAKQPTSEQDVKRDEIFEQQLERLVDQKINDLLSDKTTAQSFINTYVGTGQKRGILQQRKEVPEPIRKLYGEISDPVANYITTMSKMGSLLSSANFLQSVYENGIGRYLFTKNDTNRTDDMVRISAANNENYGPIDGLYTYPELAKGLFPKNSQQFMFNNKLSDIYLKYFMAYPRAAKTVLSLSTQMINFLSNINFALINGHAPISIMNGTMDMDSYKKSLKAIIATLTNKSDEELGKTIEIYYDLGIIDQSVDVRELRDMLKESTNEEDLLQRFTQEPTYKKQAGNALTRPLKKLFKVASKAYRVGDDFWKIMGYEQESKTLAKVLFDKDINDLTDSELKQVQEEAGEMVKNQYPNYSRIPKIGKILKASPIIGNFISFQLESYRTAYNVAFGKQGFASLINRGNKAGKDTPKGKRLRKEGFRKLANMLGYIAMRDGAFYALAKFSGGKLLGGILPMLGIGGFDDDEPRDDEQQTLGGLTVKEQAIRDFVYNWQKNSKLIVYQASDGKLKFLDATTFDPFQMIDRLVNGFMQSKSGLDIIQGTFMENLQTFASLDFVIDAAIKSYESYKRKGSQNLFTDFLQPFLSRAMAPGTVLQIEDAIGKGVISGRDVKEAKPLKLLGYRDYDIDVEKQLYFNLEPKRRKQLARESSYRGDIYKLVEKLENGGMFSDSDLDNIVKSYKQVNESRKDSWTFVLDQVISALILGANPENVKRTLQGRKIGFSKKEVDALFDLGFIPIKVNPLAKPKNKSDIEKALES